MNSWIIFIGLCIAAFVGAVIEHVRTSARYEFRIQHLHNHYVAEIKRNAKLAAKLEAEHAEPIDVILDRLVDECPDESEVKTFTAGQDPRD